MYWTVNAVQLNKDVGRETQKQKVAKVTSWLTVRGVKEAPGGVFCMSTVSRLQRGFCTSCG